MTDNIFPSALNVGDERKQQSPALHAGAAALKAAGCFELEGAQPMTHPPPAHNSPDDCRGAISHLARRTQVARRAAGADSAYLRSMTTHTSTVQIDVSAERLWTYLSDVENLPEYLPQMTSAHRTSGDTVQVTAQIDPSDQPAQEVEGEAWFTVKEQGKTLTWGSQGPNNYQGQLDIDAAGDSACELTVRINSERAQSEDVEAGVQRTAEGIKRAAETKHG